MRTIFVASLGLIAMATGASAQVQQNNPNATNQSMDRRNSEMRSLRQENTTQNDMLRMQTQQNQTGTFAPNTGPNALPPGGGTGVGAIR